MQRFPVERSRSKNPTLELFVEEALPTEGNNFIFSFGEGELDKEVIEKVLPFSLASVEYDDVEIELSENAMTVLERRYLKRDEQGNIKETPQELFRRVAKAIAYADLQYESEADVIRTEGEFYGMMARLEFLPNSPTLMNAGRKLGQLSACFVLPVEDSMESIFETIKNTALIHKSGGGTGFSFSRIRPNGDLVQSTKGVSSGPISFMNVFDAATEAIKQGGTRRGANMAILRVDHPDILDFIDSKLENDRLNNFNISVSVTDKFMNAVKTGTDYDLINPRTSQPAGKLNAREVFDRIVKRAWHNGDPGIIFIDRINASNPTPDIGEIESTNPCGEQPLLPYESCNLGSINLSMMVCDGQIDFDKLRKTVRNAIHFLDNVIDVNIYPLPEIDRITRGNRKIGLGVMGFADMLIKMNIPYNSEDALKIADIVMDFINEEALIKSQELAQERGAFPNFKKSIYYKQNQKPVRNATRTTIAPTGTLSILANCSSGIEPIFALCFVRKVLDNDELLSVNPLFEEYARCVGFYDEKLMGKIAKEGSLTKFDEVPDGIKKLFVTSHDMTPEWHIKMQAAFQMHTDNAVSKTVNFANHASEDDVRDVYMLAYDHGCKGVTIYRDGSRDLQVLNKGTKEAKKESVSAVKYEEPERIERPMVLNGRTIKMTTGCGSLYVTINETEQGPFELFNTIGKAGGCAASQSEAIGRLVSLALRSGIEPERIIKNLSGISCHKPYGFGEGKNLSCADAIAKAFKTYLHVQNIRSDEEEWVNSFGACPDCGGPMEHEGGCVVCRSCGYSECT
ncbi:vitamin B12-dependent ribonucleotide reductase [candidate division KSB1 bacterium]|nr:vitamin B12-dependent ribonucleotide reductase [candidate division KSB1 bacterium]